MTGGGVMGVMWIYPSYPPQWVLSYFCASLRCCNPSPGILGSCEGIFWHGNSCSIWCVWGGQEIEILMPSFCWCYLHGTGFWENAGRSMIWYSFRGLCGRGGAWIEPWRTIKTNKSLRKQRKPFRLEISIKNNWKVGRKIKYFAEVYWLEQRLHYEKQWLGRIKTL